MSKPIGPRIALFALVNCLIFSPASAQKTPTAQPVNVVNQPTVTVGNPITISSAQPVVVTGTVTTEPVAATQAINANGFLQMPVSTLASSTPIFTNPRVRPVTATLRVQDAGHPCGSTSAPTYFKVIELQLEQTKVPMKEYPATGGTCFSSGEISWIISSNSVLGIQVWHDDASENLQVNYVLNGYVMP